MCEIFVQNNRKCNKKHPKINVESVSWWSVPLCVGWGGGEGGGGEVIFAKSKSHYTLSTVYLFYIKRIFS